MPLRAPEGMPPYRHRLRTLLLRDLSREGEAIAREESHIIEALIRLMQKHEVKVLVQVGAEDGYEANEIRKVTRCRSVCCEPDPRCAPVSVGLEWHEVLIGGENSIVPFYLNSTLGLSSKVTRSDSNEMLAQMPQIRLDTFCERHLIKPDALIVDVEGCTLDVLLGLGEDLLKGVRVIYAEVNHDNSRGDGAKAEAVDAYLTERGFWRHMSLPTYSCGGQSNWSFTRSPE